MFPKSVNSIIGIGDHCRYYLPLLSDLKVAKGVGIGTFTRAAMSGTGAPANLGGMCPDYNGVLQPVMLNCAPFEGARIVTNLAKNSSDFSSVNWSKNATCTVTGTNQINTPAASDYLYQTLPLRKAGGYYTAQVVVSGSGTVQLNIYSLATGNNTVINITLTATPTRYTVSQLATLDDTTVYVRLGRFVGNTATSFIATDLMVEAGQVASEFILTTAAPVTKCYATLLNGSPIPGLKGYLSEPASTNKCTCYSVPRADALGSELLTLAQQQCDSGWVLTGESTVSGVARIYSSAGDLSAVTSPPILTKGKVYIASYTVVSVVAGTLSNGSNTLVWPIAVGSNTITFVADAANLQFKRTSGVTDITIDNISIKEAIDYIGTKAYHDGTAFQNPITGMTLSGSDTLGTEMLANPDFTTNTTGWGGSAGATLASVAGGQSGNCLQLTATSGATQTATTSSMTTVIGARYRVTIYVKSGTSGNESVSLFAFTSVYANEGSVSVTSSGVWQLLTVEFVATTTSTLIQLKKNTATLGTMLFDTASFKTIAYPAVLSIADDTAEISTSAYQNLVNGGKVYKLDNSTGSSVARVFIGGGTANTNLHRASIYYRSTANILLRDGWTVTVWSAGSTSATYVSKLANAITPGNNGTTIMIEAAIGCVCYFIAPQLEEQSAVVASSSYIPVFGSPNTRAGTVLSAPTSGNIQVAAGRIEFEWTPGFAATVVIGTQCLWSSYTDANNELSINYNGVILYALKKVAGVSEYVTIPLSVVAGTTYTIALKINPNGTMNLSLNGVWDLGGLGSELFTNGGFDTDTIWTKGAGWTIAGGLAVGTSVAAYTQLSAPGINTAAIVHQISGTVIVTAGSISFAAGGNAIGSPIGASGTYTYSGISGIYSTIGIQSNVLGFTGTIDNMSARQVYNNTTTLTPVISSTMQIGSLNGASQTVGRIKILELFNTTSF